MAGGNDAQNQAVLLVHKVQQITVSLTVEGNDAQNQVVRPVRKVQQITVLPMVEGKDVPNRDVHPVLKAQQITVKLMVGAQGAPIVLGGLIQDVVMLNMTGIAPLVLNEYFQMTPDLHTFTNIQKRVE